MAIAEAQRPTPGAAATPDRKWWILAVLAVAQLMVVLDATIVNIALPSAQRALDFSTSDRQWVVTAYSLAFGGLLLLAGRLADLFGRKRTLMIGLIGFAAASAVGGAATDFSMLVAARAAQGAFGAILAPSALSLLTTTFSESSDRNKAFGIYGAVAGGGGAIGLLLGGVLTEYLDWRWCLYVNVAFAVVATIGAAVLLTNPRREDRPHLDIPGTIAVVGGLVALVYGFSEAESRGWVDPVTLGCIVGGVLLLAVFVVIESRVAHPLLPLRVVLDRYRGASYLAIGLSGMASFGVFLFLTYFLQQTLGFSPVRSGLAFLPMIAALMAASLVATNRLLPRFGPRWLVTGGLLCGAAGMALLTQLTTSTSYLTGMVPGLLLVGLGLGLVFGSAINVGTAGADPGDAGVASAMVSTSQQIGGSIGTSLLNTLAASATADYVSARTPTHLVRAAASVHGDVIAITVVAVIFALAALLTVVVYPSGRVELDEAAVALA